MTFIIPFQQARKVPWLPQVLLGIVSIIAGLAALLLPETRWRPLPETVEEVEIWDGKRPGRERRSTLLLRSIDSQTWEKLKETDI